MAKGRPIWLVRTEIEEDSNCIEVHTRKSSRGKATDRHSFEYFPFEQLNEEKFRRMTGLKLKKGEVKRVVISVQEVGE